MKYNSILILPALLILSSCNNSDIHPQPSTPTVDPAISATNINYAVVKTYPHDTTLYTEGLVMHDGQLFESSGAVSEIPYTISVAGITDLRTGKFTKKVELDKKIYFGEGIVFLKDKMYQLTYKNQKGFVYDAKTFKQISTFKYSNLEGWALTTDSTNLIMSDGSGKLTVLEPATLKPINIISITDNGIPDTLLNELEFIRGYIYANIYTKDIIVKVDPSNGKVVGKIDLSALTQEAKVKHPSADVLNGIAYDPATDKIYVTGKLWENIYEISFAH